jgi:hypothetical protein
MPKNKNPHPMLRVILQNGDVIYPRFEKDTQGKWRVKDKSLLMQPPLAVTSSQNSLSTSNQTTPTKEQSPFT